MDKFTTHIVVFIILSSNYGRKKTNTDWGIAQSVYFLQLCQDMLEPLRLKIDIYNNDDIRRVGSL